MSKRRFYLRPFHPVSEQIYSICVDIDINSSFILLNYSLVGPVSKIKLPPRSKGPIRKDGLWETTCFEFFIAEKSGKNYWEFNFSPSLDWQFYEFAVYREGRRDGEAARIDLARFESPTHIEIEAKISGLPILANPKQLEGSATLVLEDMSGVKTFWAIEHRGEHADFHRRDSFVILNR